MNRIGLVSVVTLSLITGAVLPASAGEKAPVRPLFRVHEALVHSAQGLRSNLFDMFLQLLGQSRSGRIGAAEGDQIIKR